MLDGISDTAIGVKDHPVGSVAWQTCMDELKALCHPNRIDQLLSQQDSERVRRQRRHRAAKLLRKAAVASSQKNWQRTFMLVRLALEAAGRDKQLVRSLLESNSLSLVIIPRRPIARDKHGLVDPRVAVISDRPPRLGFVPR